MQPGFSTAPNWIRELGFGVGIGLSNIKKCADTMKLDSQVGMGTRLEIVIHIQPVMNGGNREREAEAQHP